MRSTRQSLYERDGIGVSCPRPGMTEPIGGAVQKMGYHQTPNDVAKIILETETTPNMKGNQVYAEGGKGSEFAHSL